jgi:hypothetical protein
MRPLLLTIALLVVPAFACAEGPALGKVTDIVVEEFGNSEPADHRIRCDNFKLSIEEIDSFLNTAFIVVGHHHFRWSPCYVKGTAMIRDVPAFWVIRPFGIGHVKYCDIDYDLASQEAIQMRDDRMSVD